MEANSTPPGPQLSLQRTPSYSRFGKDTAVPAVVAVKAKRRAKIFRFFLSIKIPSYFVCLYVFADIICDNIKYVMSRCLSLYTWLGVGSKARQSGNSLLSSREPHRIKH